MKKVPERGDENFFFRKTYPLMVILIEKKVPERGDENGWSEYPNAFTHLLKKVPEKGDENYGRNVLFLKSSFELKKSPRGRGRRQNCLLLR